VGGTRGGKRGAGLNKHWASPSGEMIRRFAGKRDDDGKKREVKASVKGTKK
jgi:hypothetical protein